MFYKASLTYAAIGFIYVTMSFAGKYTVKCTIYTQLEKKNERHVAFDVLSHPFQIYSKLPSLARDLIFDLQFIEKLLIT